MSEINFEDQDCPSNWEENLTALMKHFEVAGRPTAEDLAVTVVPQDFDVFSF